MDRESNGELATANSTENSISIYKTNYKQVWNFKNTKSKTLTQTLEIGNGELTTVIMMRIMSSIKKIMEEIEVLASENMTEDGIHHDDWSDREHEYIHDILETITSSYEYEHEN